MKKVLSVISVFILIYLLLTQPFTVYARTDVTDEILKIITTDLSENEYGGCYIENGVVHLLAINETSKDCLNHLTKLGCIIENASYSLSYLKTIMDEITEISKGSKSVIIELNDRKNNIVVSIFGEDDTERLTSILQKKDYYNILVFDSLSSCISIAGSKNIEKSMTATNNVFAGTTLSCNGGYTAGFCLGSGGFYMCGHYLSIGSIIKTPTGTTIGTVTKQQLSGNADAAYVTITNPNWSAVKKWVTGETYYAGLMYNRYYTVGTYVKMKGSQTTTSTGVIQSSSVSFTIGGIQLTDQVKASYTCKNGDSGAAVFNLSSVALGIQSAGANYNSTSQCYMTSFFSKYENVVAI